MNDDPAVSAGGSLLAAFGKMDEAARQASARALQRATQPALATWPAAEP